MKSKLEKILSMEKVVILMELPSAHMHLFGKSILPDKAKLFPEIKTVENYTKFLKSHNNLTFAHGTNSAEMANYFNYKKNDGVSFIRLEEFGFKYDDATRDYKSIMQEN